MQESGARMVLHSCSELGQDGWAIIESGLPRGGNMILIEGAFRTEAAPEGLTAKGCLRSCGTRPSLRGVWVAQGRAYHSLPPCFFTQFHRERSSSSLICLIDRGL